MKKYNWKDFLIPVVSSTVGGVGIAYFFFNKICKYELDSLFEKLIDIVINFGLTFLAFTLTGFALIQLLATKKWFNQLRATRSFDVFINNFSLAVIINMAIFFISLGLKIFWKILPVQIQMSALAFSIASVIFSCLWLWQCIGTLIDLIKSND